MGILQRHILKEILITFAIAFVVITFLLLVGEVLHELADRFMNKGLTMSELGAIAFYILPPLTAYTMPVALLFATLIVFIQLSQDCEIIAMKASGIPLRSIFVPAICIGIAATILLLAVQTEVAPWAKRKLKVFLIEAVLRKPTLVLSEQSWTREVNNMRIFVGDIDGRRMELRDVNIQVSGENAPDRTIVAKGGTIYLSDNRDKIFLQLSEGSIHEYDTEQPDRYSTTTFNRLTIPVSIGAIERYIKRYQKLDSLAGREMSLGEIAKTLGKPSVKPADRRRLLRLLGEQTALAFMPLTFALIGAPLGIVPYRTRRFYGMAVCAVLVLAYYSLLILGETLSEKDLMNPIVAMWIPNFFLGAAGIALIIRAEGR